MFKGKILIVISHWDDESLLMGGFLKKYGRGAVVVCCTIKDWVKDHQGIFNRICINCGAIPITLPIHHRVEKWNGKGDIISFFKQATPIDLFDTLSTKLLTDNGIDIGDFGTIITHGYDGDLGRHHHHKQVNRFISKVSLDTQDVFNLVNNPTKDGCIELELDRSLLEWKSKIISLYFTERKHKVLFRKSEKLELVRKGRV